MNAIPLICFDIETTGLEAGYHEVCQLAAIAYDPITLDPIPKEEGGVFDSLLKPLHEDRIQEQAMRTHKIPLEVLRKAPHPKAVWIAFLEYLKQFNPKGQKRIAPIPCGKNIRKFDLPFIYHLSSLYSPKKDKQIVFNELEQIDLQDLIRHWFWFDKELDSMSMDRLREFFGMRFDSAHQALRDVEQTGYMITHFMKVTRELRLKHTVRGEPLLDFKAAFAGV